MRERVDFTRPVAYIWGVPRSKPEAKHLETLTHPVPLQKDDAGVWRIAGTRLNLDLLVAKYWQGWTPEQIVDAHPALNVANVYAILAWYLGNRSDVDQYLECRLNEAARLKNEIEQAQGRASVVERLAALAKEQREQA